MPQSLFVAIVGDNNNGHNFIQSSFDNGANSAIVNHTHDVMYPNCIIVEDTTLALGLLAKNYRNTFTNIPIVAITGSNGKTTIKEMLKKVCEVEFGEEHVLASKNSFNNQWGVPLTILQIRPTHKVVILEMGMNHHGELHYLSEIAHPTIATVNNVLLSHVGFFKDLTDIAHAKGEIYDGIHGDNVALINTQVPYHTMWVANLRQRNCKMVRFGSDGELCYLQNVDDDGNINIMTKNGEVKFKLNVLGDHNIYNSVTVLALSILIGCSISSIESGLKQYTPYSHRMEKFSAFNGAIIIDDSYNGNPDSVKSAILAVAKLPKPLWMVFGDLGELGAYTESEHIKLGEFMHSHHVDNLLTIGQYTLLTGNKYIECTGDINSWCHFESIDNIVQYCKSNLPENATLLVKGSNSMQLWQVVNQLKEEK